MRWRPVIAILKFTLRITLPLVLVLPASPQSTVPTERTVTPNDRIVATTRPIGVDVMNSDRSAGFQLETLLVLLQTLLIAVLLFERRRQRLAKQLLDKLNADLKASIEARIAALNAKNRELDSFAYSVAHDLKSSRRYLLRGDLK